MSGFICDRCGIYNDLREFMPITTKTIIVRWCKWEKWLRFWSWLDEIDHKVYITEQMTMKNMIDEVVRVFGLVDKNITVTFSTDTNVEVIDVKKFEHQELYYVKFIDKN